MKEETAVMGLVAFMGASPLFLAIIGLVGSVVDDVNNNKTNMDVEATKSKLIAALVLSLLVLSLLVYVSVDTQQYIANALCSVFAIIAIFFTLRALTVDDKEFDFCVRISLGFYIVFVLSVIPAIMYSFKQEDSVTLRKINKSMENSVKKLGGFGRKQK